jgi:hypothetical protein
VKQEYGVRQYQERVRAFFCHRRKGAVELIETSRPEGLQLHPQCPGRDLRLPQYLGLEDDIIRIPEDRQTRDFGDGRLEQLQRFPDHLGAHGGRPRDVSAGSRKASDEPGPHRIGYGHHDDRDRPGGILGCQRCLRNRRNNDVDLELDQLCRKIGEPPN